MTAGTVPSRPTIDSGSSPSSNPAIGMGGAARAELRKIFTTRLWWGLLVALVLVSGGLSGLFGALAGSKLGGARDNPFLHVTVGTAQLIYSAGFIYNLTPLIPLALGVLLITQEFRHQTISATFLAVPRRSRAMVAKVVAVVAIGIVYGVLHDVFSVGVGATVLEAKGLPTWLGAADVWRTVAISVLVFCLWALLGFGFGLLVRNQIAAVFVALGVAFIAHIALSIVFGVLKWHTAAKFLPDNLSIGMLVTKAPGGVSTSSGDPYFSWWVSGLILLGYSAVLSILGCLALSRRDVS